MTAHLNNNILNPLKNVINLLVYTIKNACLALNISPRI